MAWLLYAARRLRDLRGLSQGGVPVTARQKMTQQEAQSLMCVEIADGYRKIGNVGTAAHYDRLAAAHLEVAAKMIPCVRGVPIDGDARKRIATAYRAILDRIM